MIVIGNDLIKLPDKQALKTFGNAGFAGFFTDKEIKLVRRQAEYLSLHTLWAMKKSAYKCLLKLGHNKAFSPHKFVVEPLFNKYQIFGIVFYGNLKLFTKCADDNSFIRCVACNAGGKLKQIKSIHLKIHEGNNKHKIISNKIQYLNHTEPLVLKENNNIPVLLNNKGTKRLEISITREDKLYYISTLPGWYPPRPDYIDQKYSEIHA